MFSRISVAIIIPIPFLLLWGNIQVHGQDLYKTPSGSKYHLATCKTVKNVSTKLVNAEVIQTMGLGACNICRPPEYSYISAGTFKDKSVGQSAPVQCNGITKAGTRCKHLTRIANGYCYQHGNQAKF